MSLLFLIGFAGSATGGPKAASGPKEDWSACRNLSGIDAILGCTPILLHKHGDDKKLSRAFYLRGLNYLNLRDLKRAEIDFLDSIRLNPGNTIAYEQLNFHLHENGATRVPQCKSGRGSGICARRQGNKFRELMKAAGPS